MLNVNGSVLRRTAFMLMVGLSAASASAEAPTLRPERSITAAGVRALQQVEPDLQNFVNQMERLPGQDAFIPVRINPDPATGFIWIDLGVGFMPRGQAGYDEGLGEKLRDINEELSSYVEGEITYLSIRSRIGGKTLNDWFPPIPVLEREEKRRGEEKLKISATPTVPGLVVINPGHGRYRHFATDTWEYQRPSPYAGTTDVYEDQVTLQYASALETYLRVNSRQFVTDVQQTRDVLNAGIYSQSGYSWAAMASRYYVERLFPEERLTIWGRFPNGTSPGRVNLRHYDEDLATRARYANYIGAETMISLHTDAAADTARGTSIVAKADDPQSVQLAENIS